MAQDFGDDAGDKMLEWSLRIMMSLAREQAREQKGRACRAFEGARGDLAAEGGPARDAALPNGWARLDMHEFSELEGWDEVREVIEERIGARGLAHEWLSDEATGRDYLLFRAGDAAELDEALGGVERDVERSLAAAEEMAERRESFERGGLDAPAEARAAGDARSSIPLRDKARAAHEHAAELAEATREGRDLERGLQRERARA